MESSVIVQNMLDILSDKVVLSLIITFAVSEILKLIVSSFAAKRFTAASLYYGGGMPSTHSSIVAALTSSMFFAYGFIPLSIAVFIFALIVVRDSFGVRKHAGIHAKILNAIVMKDAKLRKQFPKPLQEHIGHRPVEAVAGVVLGLAVSLIVCFV